MRLLFCPTVIHNKYHFIPLIVMRPGGTCCLMHTKHRVHLFLSHTYTPTPPGLQKELNKPRNKTLQSQTCLKSSNTKCVIQVISPIGIKTKTSTDKICYLKVKMMMYTKHLIICVVSSTVPLSLLLIATHQHQWRTNMSSLHKQRNKTLSHAKTLPSQTHLNSSKCQMCGPSDFTNWYKN